MASGSLHTVPHWAEK